MRSKIPIVWLLIILGVVIVAYFLVGIFFLNSFSSWKIPSTKSSSLINNQFTQNGGSVSSGLPVRLKIPEINIDAAIEYVGITTQGIMGAPSEPTSTAWFDLGPLPGQIGSAVIAGHEGWKNGIAAVFDDLYKLKVGDKIYVEDEHGTTITFVVQKLRTYDPNGDASNVFISSDGKAHLNLITCEGTWNATQKSYSNRLVIFADEE